MVREPPKECIDWPFTLPLVLGTMMNPLNSTMLSTALTSICNSFARGISSGALLITPLYIASAIGQPLMGKLADIYNPKLINRLGFVLILIASVIGVVAPSFGWLIVSRVILGLGTSAAYPSAMALVAQKYQRKGMTIPGNILGIITIASQVSTVIGPMLGGFLTQISGWRGIFFINVPWVLCALYFSKNIPSGKRKQQKTTISSVFKNIDIIGIGLFATSLVLLMIILTQHHLSVAPIGITILFFIFFILWERKQTLAFIDIRLLWHQPSLLLVYIRTMATNYVMYLLLYGLPQWVEGTKNMSPAQTGLIMFPMSIISATSAMLTSRSNNLFRVNTVSVVTIGMACSFIFLLNQTVPIWIITLIIMFTGVPVGVNLMANQLSLGAEAPANQIGISFGLYRTFGYLGAIVSGAQLKTIFHKGATDTSLHLLGWFSLVSCILLVILYLFSLRKRQGKRE